MGVPMAATLTQERFTGPAWIFEPKYDGIRLLAFRKGTSVRLLSRNQLPQHYPAIADVIGKLLVGAGSGHRNLWWRQIGQFREL
jgi:ATP-dependent DNA ligase